MGEKEIDLEETNQSLVDIEKAVQKALHKHNAFLKDLGLPLLLAGKQGVKGGEQEGGGER